MEKDLVCGFGGRISCLIVEKHSYRGCIVIIILPAAHAPDKCCEETACHHHAYADENK